MANSSKRPQPQIPTPVLTRLATQSQLEFELDFFPALLAHHPDYVEGLKVHAKNLAVLRRHAEGLQVDRRIARLRPADSLAHYNLACSLALTQHPDDALAALQRAVELGYRDFPFMKQDRDLDSVRKDPRFRAILREHEKKR